jgi:putative membrane-bound dehydrogenase-like protein
MLRPLLVLCLALVFCVPSRAVDPLEIKDGDRVLFLGDTLLEREGTYGAIETRLQLRFPDRHFIVRNLAFSADTPLGWSRASFDPVPKGFEHLKEEIDLVKPTVVFLGYGMAASLQEMTDLSGDPTLNPDPARYGAEPMSAPRFKRELAQLMDTIVEISGKDTNVRFILLSPIRHEDLRKFKPGLPDPAAHNQLLGRYTKAIEELASERKARFVNLFESHPENSGANPSDRTPEAPAHLDDAVTSNGIHLNERGYASIAQKINASLFPTVADPNVSASGLANAQPPSHGFIGYEPFHAAILRKNELFFHRWRPANSTYLFGFRKHEQGQNAKEIPEFDPLIAEADAKIDALKGPATGNATDSRPVTPAPIPAVKDLAPIEPLPTPEFTLDDGLKIELWAENPLLFKPTQMNWDPQGRLWVASSALYPMITPGGEATDKILILDDPDHTGKAARSKIFAEGLLLPTGVAPTPQPTQPRPPHRYGGFVGPSTELLYFEDSTGLGKADQRHIVLSGFGTEDTHHIVHTLKWGPDGRLYMDQSIYIHTHTETPWGVVRLNAGGVLSWDPRTEKVEVFDKGLWNSWGHQFDEWGQNFQTDGAGSTGLSWSFPGAVFAPSEGARRTMQSISPGSYPKFASLELIHSPHFPADWQGTAITCDFRAHRIVRFSITDLANPNAEKDSAAETQKPASSNQKPALQAGYTTKELADIVRTSDVAFRPIDVKLGPDGALYVADWSNPVINHGEVDFRDPRRDHVHGRIWRITKKDGPLVQWEDLTQKSVDALFALFGQPGGPRNLWEREQAQRVLATRPASQIESASREFLRGQPSAERYALLNALRSGYYGLHLEAYTPPQQPITAAQVRESITGLSGERIAQTLNLLLSQTATAESAYRDQPARRDAFRAQVLAMAEAYLGHPHPRVRLGAVRVLGAIPTAESASLVLDEASKNTSADPFLDFAIWRSINDLAKPWTEAIASGAWKIDGREKQIEYGLAAIDPQLAGVALAKILSNPKFDFTKGPWIDLVGHAGGPAELTKLFAALTLFYGPDCCPGLDTSTVKIPNLSEAEAQRTIDALISAARDRGTRPEGDLELAKFVEAAPDTLRPGLLRLAGFWKTKDAGNLLPDIAINPPVKIPLRLAAIDGLRALGGDHAVKTLTSLCATDQPFPIRRAALAALAAVKLQAALPEVQSVLHDAPNEGEAVQAWRPLLNVQGGIDAIKTKFDDRAWAREFPASTLSAALKAAGEKGHAGALLVKSIQAAGGKTATTPRDLAAEIAGMVKAVQSGADPAQGELVYRRLGCALCHSIGGAGGKLGPDLSTIGASAPLDYIVESVYDPNAKIKEGFHAFAYTMKDGSQFTGIPTRETATEQFIRPGPVPEIPLIKANIVKRELVGSLMPGGLADALPFVEKRSLFAFLSQLGRPGPFDASKGSVARLWRIYPGSQAADAEHAEKVDQQPVLYTLVDGRLPREQFTASLAPLNVPGDSIVATTQFQLAAAGKTRLDLTGVSKAWLDGQALAIASEPNPVAELSAGTHTLAVQFDAKSLPEVFRVEIPSATFLGN